MEALGALLSFGVKFVFDCRSHYTIYTDDKISNMERTVAGN